MQGVINDSSGSNPGINAPLAAETKLRRRGHAAAILERDARAETGNCAAVGGAGLTIYGTAWPVPVSDTAFSTDRSVATAPFVVRAP